MDPVREGAWAPVEEGWLWDGDYRMVLVRVLAGAMVVDLAGASAGAGGSAGITVCRSLHGQGVTRSNILNRM